MERVLVLVPNHRCSIHKSSFCITRGNAIAPTRIIFPESLNHTDCGAVNQFVHRISLAVRYWFPILICQSAEAGLCPLALPGGDRCASCTFLLCWSASHFSSSVRASSERRAENAVGLQARRSYRRSL